MTKENKQPIDIIAKMRVIHYEFLGNRKEQAVKLIDEYGVSKFWADYRRYLYGFYKLDESQYHYFSEAVITYHKLK